MFQKYLYLYALSNLIKFKPIMKNVILFLALLVSFTGIAQAQNITKKDIESYLSETKQSVIGYSFIVEQAGETPSKDDVVIQIFDPMYRQIIEKQVTYLPDGYPCTEGAVWEYLKWRYKTYTKEGKQIPFEGFVKAEPILESIPFSKDLNGFIKFLDNKKDNTLNKKESNK